MSFLNQIKAEIKAKGREINERRQQVVLCEQAWFKDNAKACERCSRDQNLTLDHIIAREMLKSFGIEPELFFWENNLRILCKPCNIFKGNRLDFSDPRTKKLLIELLERV